MDFAFQEQLREPFAASRCQITIFEISFPTMYDPDFLNLQGKNWFEKSSSYRIFSIKRRTPIKCRPRINAGSKRLFFK